MTDRDSADYETQCVLFISSDDLAPDDVTRRLQVTPTRTSNDPIKRGAKRLKNFCFWRYKNPSSVRLEKRPVQTAVEAIIDNPKIDLQKIAALPGKWRKEIVVTIFSDDRPVICLSQGPEFG
ncbi:DUF4279 domain-containing protein [Parvularcula sp. LCG005]|uniref:DUF4279 domain-containing protein n=1 Tax=Parvularcula sp. LCG005 TaxID=3078805 RepID=UPI0029439CCF|nr:DUF4279 domain-containing protein [Parvularcula sp. LCG005]WOI54414.1 DUF4279 domain-containing protein [Parvularcula sp. LCG005]